jgi:hypothetical protein
VQPLSRCVACVVVLSYRYVAQENIEVLPAEVGRAAADAVAHVMHVNASSMGCLWDQLPRQIVSADGPCHENCEKDIICSSLQEASQVQNQLIEHNFESFVDGRYLPKEHLAQQFSTPPGEDEDSGSAAPPDIKPDA